LAAETATVTTIAMAKNVRYRRKAMTLSRLG